MATSYNSPEHSHLAGNCRFNDADWLSNILFTNKKDKFYLYRDNKLLNKDEFKFVIDQTIKQYFTDEKEVAVLMSGSFNCDYIDITEQLNKGLAMNSS